MDERPVLGYGRGRLTPRKTPGRAAVDPENALPNMLFCALIVAIGLFLTVASVSILVTYDLIR